MDHQQGFIVGVCCTKATLVLSSSCCRVHPPVRKMTSSIKICLLIPCFKLLIDMHKLSLDIVERSLKTYSMTTLNSVWSPFDAE